MPTPTGGERVSAHPAVKIAADAATALLRLESALGITASGRARLNVVAPEDAKDTPFKTLGGTGT